jgi:outer membrane receptor protein involved in Fe transport
MVPQLHISQHSGSGKGHQIFLRGFDVEHGQDLALYFEGVPINEPSHVHGIGYTDLHFLIPEVVKRMEVLKGPYDPRYGGFATAGAVNFVLKDHLNRSYLAVGGGSFKTLSATAAFSPKLRFTKAMVAVQGFTTEGFTDPGQWRGARALAKFTRRAWGGKLSVVAAAYGSLRDAADAIPERLVRSGGLDFYGGLDPSDGGSSQRQHLSAHYLYDSSKTRFRANLYLYRRRTVIYSNYTYLLQHPDHGDQTEQDDARWVTGAWAEMERTWKLGRVLVRGTMGASYRHDSLTLTLNRTENRLRWDPGADLDIMLHDLGVYLKGEIIPARWVRIVLGGRYDHLLFDVDGVQDFVRPSGAIDHDRPVSGVAGRSVFTPRASVIITPHRTVDLFLNFGSGFHPPDARDPVLNRDCKVPLAWAGETGVRVRVGRWLDLAAAFWGTYMEQELFFDPTLGRSVDVGRSRRLGGELEARVKIRKHAYLYADGSYTDARLVDTGDPVPGSPRWLLTAGAVGRYRIRTGPRPFKGSRIRGGIRVRYIGQRDLLEGQKGLDAVLGDLLVNWDFRRFGLELSIVNFWNQQWRDAQYYYTSRAGPTEPLGGIPDMHFTAGTPLEVKATLRVYLP